MSSEGGSFNRRRLARGALVCQTEELHEYDGWDVTGAEGRREVEKYK